MANYSTVSIIIQARSTSKRFPGKIFEKIGVKTVLQHVIDACYNSAQYINKFTNKHGIVCGVALAVPTGDELIPKYQKHRIFEGPENDVLKRYVMAANELESDYIVRITADCPFIPPYIISKLINLAVENKLDFVTNADPVYRTAPDGHDVQIMSRRMLNWLDENSREPAQREHVTTLTLQEPMPQGFLPALVVGFADLSAQKFSIDTPEDLENMKAMHDKLYRAVNDSGWKVFRL